MAPKRDPYPKQPATTVADEMASDWSDLSNVPVELRAWFESLPVRRSLSSEAVVPMRGAGVIDRDEQLAERTDAKNPAVAAVGRKGGRARWTG